MLAANDPSSTSVIAIVDRNRNRNRDHTASRIRRIQ
jgi:hypothetical protein